MIIFALFFLVITAYRFYIVIKACRYPVSNFSNLLNNRIFYCHTPILLIVLHIGLAVIIGSLFYAALENGDLRIAIPLTIMGIIFALIGSLGDKMIEIITHLLIVTAFTAGGLLTLALIIAEKQDNKNRQTLTNESSRPNKERDLLLLPNTMPDTRRNRRTSQTGLEQPERIIEIEERLIKVETKINYSIVLQIGIFLTALGIAFG